MPKPNWEVVITSAIVYVVLTIADAKFGFTKKLASFFDDK